MTREEAIKTLKDRIEQYTGGVHPGEREILLEAFAVLPSFRPTPDPITGLVLCGCGGKASNEDFFDGFFHLSRVTCPKCGIEVTTADGRAKVAWNRAMGMLEVEG